jgi:uncharacterized protein
MPEYLAPGVFVEEVSFRSRSIEGVATSTTGMAGLTRYGPVPYNDSDITGPLTCEPRLITSYFEFERVYGGLASLRIDGTERIPYLAHAVRAFFENGGRRVYISRVFAPNLTLGTGTGRLPWGIASLAIPVAGTFATWQARWPGADGNLFVETSVVRTKNVAYEVVPGLGPVQARRAKAGAVVEFVAGAAADPNIAVPDGNDPLDPNTLRVVEVDENGVQSFIASDGTATPPTIADVVQLVELSVRMVVGTNRIEEYVELGAHEDQKRYIGRILARDEPEDPDAPAMLAWDPTTATDPQPRFLPARLMVALQGNPGRLTDGSDGMLPGIADFNGLPADLDDPEVKATGLEALAEIDDIAIVAIPDGADMGNTTVSEGIAGALIGHAERLQYRIAIVDGPISASLNQIRDFRGKFDSTYAAIYYPAIRVFDPTERAAQGAPPKQIALPPSGFVAGIYARNDITRGVHKAPANEVVRGLTRFEFNVNRGRQEVINPEGINALRLLEGRGNRVWGARTMTSDPEWKYVNVRRLFIFIEHSIDKSTQWSVFEPNNRLLWNNIRRSVEDFLMVLWRDGALLGAKPAEAFFVRCDRTTMTQNDLDNGRLICLIGVAPVKPAEFVIFRIGQWTADARG